MLSRFSLSALGRHTAAKTSAHGIKSALHTHHSKSYYFLCKLLYLQSSFYVSRDSVWASKNRNRCLRADIWHQQTSTKSTWTTSRSHRRLWQKGSTRDSYWLTTNLQPHRLPQGWVITSVTQAWHRRIPKLASVALLLFLAHLYLRIKSTAILTSFSYRSLKVWATCTVYWL